MMMVPSGMTQLYQAERVKTVSEQRRADAEIGMTAAGAARRWRRIARILRFRGTRTGNRFVRPTGARRGQPGQGSATITW
jgi:hypothetical protein